MNLGGDLIGTAAAAGLHPAIAFLIKEMDAPRGRGYPGLSGACEEQTRMNRESSSHWLLWNMYKGPFSK